MHVWLTNHSLVINQQLFDVLQPPISQRSGMPFLTSTPSLQFPISQRSGIAALVEIATGAGLAAGQGLSALTGGSNWRLPFVIVAIPNLAVAVLMLLTTPDPPRGAACLYRMQLSGPSHRCYMSVV
jgi:hypothetical protein